jgi:hypothetical protein
MANIFKTTLKKDIIADIANNNIREIRFPITKFWATRLADKYEIDEKVFDFKTFDTLELSSPSNKDTDAMTYVFGFVKTYVDNDEFVVEFCDITDEVNNVDFLQTVLQTVDSDIDFIESLDDLTPNDDYYIFDDSDYDLWTNNDEIVVYNEEDVEEDDIPYIYIPYVFSNDEVLDFFNKWINEENILEYFYEDENVFATNAIQVIVLPNGKVLGFKKSLPVNNDVEVRIEFDNNKKIYFDEFQNSDSFKEYVLKTLSEIRKNNFVFIWKRYTGIFIDSNDRVYFGIKYSTRKSIGFNRKYKVQ